MPTVRLDFSPAPAHVRTARLVAVAVAQHAGVAEAALDEVRQAIGEACTRAVARHMRHGLTDLIEVIITDDEQFEVHVIDRAPADTRVIVRRPPEDDDEDTIADTAGFALLTGLVQNLDVSPRSEGPGTEVTMVWPIRGASTERTRVRGSIAQRYLP
jgi:serine/threonine-protein kinase RsbW